MGLQARRQRKAKQLARFRGMNGANSIWKVLEGRLKYHPKSFSVRGNSLSYLATFQTKRPTASQEACQSGPDVKL